MNASIEQRSLPEDVIPEGIAPGYYRLSLGPIQITVLVHGAINLSRYEHVPITSHRSLSMMLCKFDEMDHQRGGGTFMGPYMPRGSEQIAQPGPVDIHGVWAGMPWELEEIDEANARVGLTLPASFWKGRLIGYYFNAVFLEESSEERQSLERLINANLRRYPEDKKLREIADEIYSLMRDREKDKSPELIGDLIESLVEYAYPGMLTVDRVVGVSHPFGEIICVINDQATITNEGDHPGIDASGFHTYWKAGLSQVRIRRESTGVRVLKPGYDRYLKDVQVRVLDQPDRVIFIVPAFELASPGALQIIYHDKKYDPEGLKEVAIECLRQPGGTYPMQGRVILPGESSKLGFQTVVIPRGAPSDEVLAALKHVNDVQDILGAPPIGIAI